MAAAIQFGTAAVGPQLQAHYGLTLTQLGVLFSVHLLTNALVLVPAGMAVDRFGSRLPTLVGGAAATVGLLAPALGSTRTALFVGLAACGVGAGVVPVAGAHVIFGAYAAGRRAWAFGVRQTAVPLAGLLAVVLVPALTAVGGVRLMFWALALGTALATVWLASIAPRHRRLPDGGGRGGLVEIWRVPGMRRILAVAALYILVVQALVVYTVPAARAAGFSSFAAQAVFFAVTLSAVVSRVAWGRLADRGGGRDRRPVLVRIGLVSAVGGCLFTLALHVGPVTAVAAGALFAFGGFGWNAIVYVMAAEHAPPGLVARALSVTFALVFLLSAAGTPALALLAEKAGWNAVWLTVACLSGVGSLVSAAPSRAGRLGSA